MSLGHAAGELPSLDHPGNFISDDATVEELYTLTNTTGSLMYMAPEVSLHSRHCIYAQVSDLLAAETVLLVSSSVCVAAQIPLVACL